VELPLDYNRSNEVILHHEPGAALGTSQPTGAPFSPYGESNAMSSPTFN